MSNNILETVTGGLVLLAAGYFLVFAANQTTFVGQGSETYSVLAQFDRVGELAVGSDVRVSGIKVGSVSSLKLDPVTYNAVAVLDIDQSVELPLDTAARIESVGLLGGSFLALIPGAELDVLIDGDKLEYTQGAIGLMDIISQALFTVSEPTSEEN